MFNVINDQEAPEQRIGEVNFNFTYKCNMACPFCYVPFNKKKADDQSILRIFDRLITIFPKRIVIGGGDPFMFDGLTDAVSTLRHNGIDVHIDSNLKRSSTEVLKRLAPLGATFGFPLDGGNAEIHDTIRAEVGHFQIILDRIATMLTLGLELKANTVVCKRNISSLPQIECLLSSRGVGKWSLYQFWPMESGLQSSDDHSIDLAAFEEAVNQIKNVTDLKIGGGNIDQRKSKYLFVRSDGSCYTVDPKNHSRYVELGSIFDQQSLKNWRSYGVLQMETTPSDTPTQCLPTFAPHPISNSPANSLSA